MNIKHKDTGSALSKTEYEGVDAHEPADVVTPTEHTAITTTPHVTAAEKTTWDSKDTVAARDSAIGTHLSGAVHTLPQPAILPIPIEITLCSSATEVKLLNMPAALTEYKGLTIFRTKVDFTNAASSRLVVRQGVAGATNAKLKVQYATDESTWVDLCLVAVGAGVGTKAGSWTAVPSGAKGDVFLRLVGIDGDGTADPEFGLIVLQVK